jgi:hypothetical protein
MSKPAVWPTLFHSTRGSFTALKKQQREGNHLIAVC